VLEAPAQTFAASGSSVKDGARQTEEPVAATIPATSKWKGFPNDADGLFCIKTTYSFETVNVFIPLHLHVEPRRDSVHL